MMSRSYRAQNDHCSLLHEVCLVYKAGHRYNKFCFNPEHWYKLYTSYNNEKNCKITNSEWSHRLKEWWYLEGCVSNAHGREW